MKTINEKWFEDAAGNFALRQVLRQIRPVEVEPIIPWLEKTVDMSLDKSAGVDGLYKPWPYQVEPIEEIENSEVHRITLAMGQRLGKSTVWRMGLLRRFSRGNCSALICYPTLDLGLKQNTTSVKPLLMSLPEVKKDFSMRGNVKVDSYISPSTSSICYFMGAGAPILSVTASFLVADEVDWIDLQSSGDDQKNTSNLKNIWLRGQTFKNRLMISVSSPTQYSGPIWKEWEDGSQGIWNNRCVHCGNLIPANKLAFWNDKASRFDGLQWEKGDDGAIVLESIIFRCPYCGYEYHEEEARQMNAGGQYVHARNNRSHRSFQCGAMGNLTLWSFAEMAQWQEDAGIGVDAKKFFHNSVLGMPFRFAKDDNDVTIEDANRRRQVAYPDDLETQLSVVCAGVDVQKDELAGQKYYVVAIRGWTEDGSSYLLWGGTAQTLDDLALRLSDTYHGHRVSFTLIDHGGFDNSQDVTPFVRNHKNVYYWKGTSAKQIDDRDWKLSENEPKLVLCNAIGWQVRLLDLLYSPPRPVGYRWYLPMDVGTEYFGQLCAVRVNGRLKYENQETYANWSANGRRDAFDAEKMALCAVDFFCSNANATAFRKGHKPKYFVKEQIVKAARMAKIGR